MTLPVPTIPMVNAGLLYVNNLQVSPGTINADLLSCATLSIAAGQCRDSTDTNDITVSSAVTLDPSTKGVVNGIDTGVLAATTLYYVWAIGDSTGYNAGGSLLSLSSTSPLLPVGYDMARRIGTVLTNAAGTRFLNFIQRGNGSGRYTYYAVPLATAIAAGASTAFATVTLTTWVPPTASHVLIVSALTADGGGVRTVVYSADASTTIAAAATAGEIIMSAHTSTVVTATLMVPCTSAAGVQTIQYAVSNALAAVAVSVSGFLDQL